MPKTGLFCTWNLFLITENHFRRENTWRLKNPVNQKPNNYLYYAYLKQRLATSQKYHGQGSYTRIKTGWLGTRTETGSHDWFYKEEEGLIRP